ncbi:MAG: PEP-CTERM sorting domain-containing protein [Lacipirellulaceae bacterium]
MVYQVDFSVETLAVFPGELGFANVGFSIATDNLDTTDSDWTPSAVAALLLETNLDAGIPDDLEGILASITGVLDDPIDIRTQIGQNGPTVIGSILVEWDGVTPASLSTEDVLFSANSASGMFLAAQSGGSSLLQFGNVPEPATLVLLVAGASIFFANRRRIEYIKQH